MFKNLDNKKKTNIFILFMIITIVLAYVIFSPSGIINRIILTNKKAEFLQKIETENRTRDSLEKQITKIIRDTTEIEKIAREKYGMKLPGEKIYIVPIKKREVTK